MMEMEKEIKQVLLKIAWSTIAACRDEPIRLSFEKGDSEVVRYRRQGSSARAILASAELMARTIQYGMADADIDTQMGAIDALCYGVKRLLKDNAIEVVQEREEENDAETDTD